MRRWTRLLQNQADIGDAIKPYYGDAAGDQLTALLRQHILGAADVLTALKAGDQAALADGARRPGTRTLTTSPSSSGQCQPENWPLEEMDAMMKDHLDATTQEALARHNQDWEADVAAYDAVHAQILEMADMLSSGIVAQFPKQFKP
jgi:hypothetical protein